MDRLQLISDHYISDLTPRDKTKALQITVEKDKRRVTEVESPPSTSPVINIVIFKVKPNLCCKSDQCGHHSKNKNTPDHKQQHEEYAVRYSDKRPEIHSPQKIPEKDIKPAFTLEETKVPNINSYHSIQLRTEQDSVQNEKSSFLPSKRIRKIKSWPKYETDLDKLFSYSVENVKKHKSKLTSEEKPKIKSESKNESQSPNKNISPRRTSRELFALSRDKFKIAFELGWRRELVYRSKNTCGEKRMADVYYYTPGGVKVRSYRELIHHIDGVNLTMDNFTFYKDVVGVGPPMEIVRNAATRVSCFPANEKLHKRQPSQSNKINMSTLRKLLLPQVSPVKNIFDPVSPTKNVSVSGHPEHYKKGMLVPRGTWRKDHLELKDNFDESNVVVKTEDTSKDEYLLAQPVEKHRVDSPAWSSVKDPLQLTDEEFASHVEIMSPSRLSPVDIVPYIKQEKKDFDDEERMMDLEDYNFGAGTNISLYNDEFQENMLQQWDTEEEMADLRLGTSRTNGENPLLRPIKEEIDIDDLPAFMPTFVSPDFP